jgi:hypothetical protein
MNMDPFLNHLNAELNPICHLLALLGAYHIFRISKIRVKLVIFILEPSFTLLLTCAYRIIIKKAHNRRNFLQRIR